MKVIGIHDGHNAGATLTVDGVVVASVCEERLTRKKNEVGFPKFSIDEVLRIAGIKPTEIDEFVYASNYMHDYSRLENINSWYKVGVSEQLEERAVPQSALQDNLHRRQRERVDQLVRHTSISPDLVSFVDHHHAHAAAAYYGSAYSLRDKVLVITCDGSGDGLSATVSIGKDGKLDRKISTGRNASLGKIYSRVTFALGLKPWEHEYKVMGLAPYADKYYAQEICEILKNYLKISADGLHFECPDDLDTNFIYQNLRDDFELKRFDAISGGVQMFTEELLVQWISNLVKHFGISKIACGGGVFMNVKANKLIAEIDAITDIFVFPSCGDESLSFGACWIKEQEKRGLSKMPGLTSPYLGSEFSDDEIELALRNHAKAKFNIDRFEDIEVKIADLLAENEVVARFSGRMEWGARALGNRSILTNPSHWPNVERINSMIKMRDFWMPFAPSMLAEKSDFLIENNKQIKSPYMMFAFDTKAETVGRISAATHPRDRTARAQLVDKSMNEKYWNLINYFYQKTGTPCVLNTSFNLHGYPLVNSPEDAIHVFQKSGLNYLALGNYLVSKETI